MGWNDAGSMKQDKSRIQVAGLPSSKSQTSFGTAMLLRSTSMTKENCFSL